jgi:hypothetical protein
VIRHGNRYEAQTIYVNHRMKIGYTRIHDMGNNQDLYIPGILRGALVYSHALYPLSMVSGINALPESEVNVVSHLSTTATRVLWNQMLGHVHHRKLYELHKHVKGIPKITMPSDVDSCSTWSMSKIRRADRGSRDTRKDTTISGQGISMDWGFICQRSKNLERYEQLSGINGETDYLIITHHKTDYIWGFPADGKAPPLAWLNRWFTEYAPADAPFRHYAIDQGGEIYHKTEVMALLAYH